MNFTILLSVLVMLPLLIYRKIKDKKESQFRLYGIYGFFGLPGKGKTMAMCKYLADMRKKHGNDFYIMTNFYYKDQ